MAEGFARNARYGRYWSALVCAWLVFVCALMLLPRRNDFLGLYSELVRFVQEDVIGMYSAGAKAPDYTKGLSLTDLKHMLASGSPAVRASAVQALGYRREDEIVTLLVQLLNDTELVDIGGERKSISALSKTALTRSIRDRITLEPSNIRILIPYLSAASQGTPLQRTSMIELLGDIKDPLSRPTLAKIAESEQNTLVRNAAQRALARIDAQDVESSAYSELSANQRWLAIVMVSLVCVLLPFMVYRLMKDSDKRLALLAPLPILICAGFAVLIAIEHSRGCLHFGTMGAGLCGGSVMSVRTASYHDQTDFPGDSYVARHLLETGDTGALSALSASSLAEPDDLDALKRMNDVRRDWIWSRMLVSKLGTPAFQDLARNSDPAVRLAVATTLSKLMVTHDEIVAALELLAKDEDEQVRTEAAEALARSRSFPKWSPP